MRVLRQLRGFIYTVVARTWNLFFELPGLVSNLFSPTFREPSLMLCELEVNGSGAASFESFCPHASDDERKTLLEVITYTLAFLTDHDTKKKKSAGWWSASKAAMPLSAGGQAGWLNEISIDY